MSVRYFAIVQRTDGKFARVYGKIYNSREYVVAAMLERYPDQAAVEAGLESEAGEERHPVIAGAYEGGQDVKVFDDLESAWVYEYAIDFVFVWRDGKWFFTHPEYGPEGLTELGLEPKKPKPLSKKELIEKLIKFPHAGHKMPEHDFPPFPDDTIVEIGFQFADGATESRSNDFLSRANRL